MKRQHIQKIIINKYSIMMTLLVCLFSLAFYGSFEKVPQDSVQLSSQATDGDLNTVDQETFYDLQLELLKDNYATVNTRKVNLKKGTVISLRIPKSALDKSVLSKFSDKSLDISKINLKDIIGKVSPKSEIEVTILKSRYKDLIGETTNLNLKSLSQRKALNAISLENSNDESEEEAFDDGKSSEGTVCTSCLGLSNFVVDKSNSKNILTGLYQKILDHSEKKITSMDEAVKSYENSQIVKDLMSTLKRGYTARNYRKHLSTRVKSGVGSRSIGACYNGVKMALLKSGLTSERLSSINAKDAGPQLEKYGFIDLLKTDYKEKLKSLYDCPKGAVVVYGGGRSGHIEICTGDGYISDYYSTTPRTGGALSGRKRFVTGIYIKSNTEINNYLASNETNKEGDVR